MSEPRAPSNRNAWAPSSESATWTPRGDAVAAWGEKPVESFAIVTAEPSPDISHIHDRMPVVLDQADFGLWLDPDPALFEMQIALLKPTEPGTLRFFQVSTKVNSAKNEGAYLIEPVALPAA